MERYAKVINKNKKTKQNKTATNATFKLKLHAATTNPVKTTHRLLQKNCLPKQRAKRKQETINSS